jgi:hypothetical protein
MLCSCLADNNLIECVAAFTIANLFCTAERLANCLCSCLADINRMERVALHSPMLTSLALHLPVKY